MVCRYKYQPSFYKRFIDDGFGIWEHGVEALKEFTEFAHSIHDNIKVELRWDDKQIEFLDTMVRIESGMITTDLYVKPTDKHIYLHKSSDHPQRMKKAIPYGLAVRLKRICSKEEDYIRHRKELKKQLRKRGYSGKFLEDQLKRADGLQREDTLATKVQRTENDRVPLVVTYSRQLPDLNDITRRRMNILHKSPRLKEVFIEAPLISYRRDRNLGDILVHGKLNRVLSDKTELEDGKKCERNSC